MWFLWRLIFSIGMLAVALVFVVFAWILYEKHVILGGVFGLLGLVALSHAIRGPKRKLRLEEQHRYEDDWGLQEWKNAESRDVKRPRDRRTKYCLDNIGRKVSILYRGRNLRIIPLRVYTKPKYQKTYVDAESDGERRTYDIDDMKLR